MLWPARASWDAENQEVVFGGDFEGAPNAVVGAEFSGGGGFLGLSFNGITDSDSADRLRECLEKTETSAVVMLYP